MSSFEPAADDRLAKLHDEYVYEINLVLDEGREDLAWALVDAYTDEALRILTAGNAAAPRG